MAIKKKSSGGGGGSNWMDTYGDMVTLLLCFFVLLYSMSTISEDKWKAIVQSFNPSAIEEATATSGNDGPSADPEEGMGIQIGGASPEETEEKELEELLKQQAQVDAAIEALFEELKNYSEQSNNGQNISVTKGDGYVFISFNDAVFFDGDSYILRREGEEVLDVVSAALDRAAVYIDELRIMGHTAQARADQPNNVWNDRLLASQRATVVTVYVQERCSLSPARIVSVGYGQHRPVASNDTAESRSHNRRVEMIITGKDLLSQLGDSIEQYASMRTGEARLRSDSGAQVPA